MSIRRSVRHLGSTINLFSQFLIPRQSPKDTVAILANALPEAKSKAQADEIMQYVQNRVIGLSSLEAFGILHSMHRYRTVTRTTPELLNDLLDSLMYRPELSENEIVRGIEIISDLAGSHWDPLDVTQKEYFPHLIAQSCDPDTLIRLGLLGINDDAVMNAKLVHYAQSITNACKLAKIGYLTGNIDVIESSLGSLATSESIDYSLRGLAAWSVNSSDIISNNALIITKLVPQLRPENAQKILWSILSTEGFSEGISISELVRVADRKIWKSPVMYSQCMMRLYPDFRPSFPLRVPQLGAVRKHGLSRKMMTELKQRGVGVSESHSSYSNYLFDLRISDGRFVDVITFPKHPDYNVYKKFIPTEQIVEVYASDLHSDIAHIIDSLTA
jgi:hypothetical protein